MNSNSQFKSRKSVERAVSKILDDHSLNQLPNAKILRTLGYAPVVNAIHSFYGNFREFRVSIDETPRVAHKQWKSQNFVLERTKEILIKHNLTELPSTKELVELGYKSYIAGVTRYHGGLQTFRTLLGQSPLVGLRKMWQNQEFVLEEAQNFMETYGFDEFPSARVLHKLGHSTLGSSIVRYHGGMTNFRKLLYETMEKSNEQKMTESLLERWLHS